MAEKSLKTLEEASVPKLNNGDEQTKGPDPAPDALAPSTTRASANVPYSAFTRSRKQVIVTIVAAAGVASTLSANIYFPALNAIQEVSTFCEFSGRKDQGLRMSNTCRRRKSLFSLILQQDFGTTAEMMNLTISLYMVRIFSNKFFCSSDVQIMMTKSNSHHVSRFSRGSHLHYGDHWQISGVEGQFTCVQW
jgi:hypothetical protein